MKCTPNWRDYTYDSKGNVISSVDLAKQQSSFEYTGNDLTKATDPKGSQFKYGYDAKHNVLSGTSAMNVVYSFTYDSNGNPLTAKVTDTGNTLFTQTSSSYTSSGNYLQSLTDSNGNTVVNNWNETKGLLTSTVDAKQKTTSYSHEANTDRLSSVTKNIGATPVTNSYSYENDRLKTINHNGFNYSFGYDSLGNNTTVSVGTQNLITNTYETVNVGGVNRLTGRLQSSTYGNGQVVSNDYDNLDRIIGKQYAGLLRYSYQYDANGNLAYQKDNVNSVEYWYIYDTANRLVKVVDSNNNSYKYNYDNNNNTSSVTDTINGTSYLTGYQYDNDNKPTSVNYTRATANTIGFQYDALGRLTTKNVNTGSAQYATTYNYKTQTLSNLTGGVTYQSHVQNVGWQSWVSDGAVSGTTGQDLRLEALKISLTSPPTGMRIKYQAHVQNVGWQDWVYDGAMAGTTGQSLRVEAVRIVLEGAPEGYGVQYQAYVQGVGWQNAVQDGQVAGTVGQSLRLEAIKINLVKIGTKTSNEITSINNNGNTISYAYEANGNIENITQNAGNIKYYYNELNELIREDNAVLNKTIVYAYDVGGNITSKTEYAYTTGTPSNPTKTYSYVYGDTNWKDKLTSFDGKAITSDAIGNPLTYDGWTYTWEEGRQLATMSKTGQSLSFKYNDAGIRTEKTVNGETTKYHLVGDKVTYEENSGNRIYYTYDSAGQLVSMNISERNSAGAWMPGVEYYYIRNAQGDIIGLFDSTGAQVVRQSRRESPYFI